MRLKRLAAVHSYGATRAQAWLAGDPPRRVVARVLGGLLARRGGVRYLALYGMNTATEAKRHAFLDRVEAGMRAL
jgi:hypothetical protein